MPKILKLVSHFLKAPATISCTNNVKIITVTMAMSTVQYHNQCLHQECSFNPKGAKVAVEGRTMSYFCQSAILHTVHGSFIRTSHCVLNLAQASYQPSPILEILISYVYFPLHPSFHPAIMPPAIKSHQNSNFTFSQAGFSHFLL